MSDRPSDIDDGEASDADQKRRLHTDRRRFLRAAGIGAAGIGGVGGLATAQSTGGDAVVLEAVTLEADTGGRGDRRLERRNPLLFGHAR